MTELLEFVALFLILLLAGLAAGIACEGIYEFDFLKVIVALAVYLFIIVWLYPLFGFGNELNGLLRMALIAPVIAGLLVILSPLRRWRVN